MIPVLTGLNCLSAVEAIGSQHDGRRKSGGGAAVSIAFRLLKRLVAQ